MRPFIDWFHSPARDIAGGVGLIVLLFVLVSLIAMVPDIIRYIRISRM